MEQIPLRWPAPFWGGPGGTGSCSPPSLRDTPLATSQPCCFGGPGIAFPRGSIVFWEVDVCCGAGGEGILPAVWLLVAGSGGTCLAHWDHLDPGGDGALGALAAGYVCLWRAGDGPRTRRVAPLPSSPPVLQHEGW